MLIISRNRAVPESPDEVSFRSGLGCLDGRLTNSYGIGYGDDGNPYQRRFLAGLAEIDPLQAGVDASVGDSMATPTETTDWAKLGTAVNAETVFVANMFRAAQGKAPLPASAAPAVNVGVTPEVKSLIVGGGLAIALGALILHR